MIVATTAAPKASASTPRNPDSPAFDYGLFVTASYNGGHAGYDGNNGGGTGISVPATPTGYFAANPRPESDFNWSDETGRPTHANWSANGEGSFTPAGTTAGTPGYNSTTSGFWFSAPTTSPDTGLGYIPNSTTTLLAGATFDTVATLKLRPGSNPNDVLSARTTRINGTAWKSGGSGNLNFRASTHNPYLLNIQADAKWSATPAQAVQSADGGWEITGNFTVTTTKDLTVQQTGSRYYAQVVIMPAQLQVWCPGGWEKFTLTSRVRQATLAHSGSGTLTTSSVTGLDTTSFIRPMN